MKRSTSITIAGAIALPVLAYFIIQFAHLLPDVPVKVHGPIALNPRPVPYHVSAVTYTESNRGEKHYAILVNDTHYEIVVPEGPHVWHATVNWTSNNGTRGSCDNGYYDFATSYTEMRPLPLGC